MTTLVDQSAEMRRTNTGSRFLEIVLLLSLALNVFILGGIGLSLWHVWNPRFIEPPDREHRFEAFFRSLGIHDLDTFPPYQQLHDGMYRKAHDMRAADQGLFDGFWDELQKPAPDSGRLKSALDEIQSHRQSFHGGQIHALVDFLVKLNPEERQAFMHTVMDRKNPVGQPMRGFIGY